MVLSFKHSSKKNAFFLKTGMISDLMLFTIFFHTFKCQTPLTALIFIMEAIFPAVKSKTMLFSFMLWK